MSFWKKLFGKANETTGEPEKPLEPIKRKDWIEHSYPCREGRKYVSIKMDPTYAEGDGRETMRYCLRVVLTLPPNQTNPMGVPDDKRRKMFRTWEEMLVNRIAEYSKDAQLVGMLTYEGNVEWVFMLGNKYPDFTRAVQKWQEDLKEYPVVTAELRDGWDYYDTYLIPDDNFFHTRKSNLRVTALFEAGSNKDALHQIKHRITGDIGQIAALKAELIKESYWIEHESATELTAFKALQLNPELIEDDMYAVINLTNAAGARYEGWTAEVVRARVITGSNQEGYGEVMTANGGLYKGTWAKGVKHGKGLFIFANGERYDGDWLEGKRTGSGTYHWGETEWYEGGFKNDLMHGQGTYHFPSGNLFSGQYKDNVRDGFGRLEWHNKTVYIGEWKNNERTGKGRLIYNEPGNSYWIEGDFLSNKAHGHAFHFSLKEKEVVHYRWVEDSMVEKLQMPAVTKPWDWNVNDSPGSTSIDPLQAHAAQARQRGMIPVLYMYDPSIPAADNLSYYRNYPPIVDSFVKASILAWPGFPDERRQRAGIPKQAILVRLDAEGKALPGTIDHPIWMQDIVSQAQEKIRAFLGE